MKNTIDSMFLSTSSETKGIDGIATITEANSAGDAGGFETTFRQALAAIDGVKSGKDLPKELLEFDSRKLTGMALTEKKLGSESSVLIGDSELSNQTVIAFAALQGMDSESLKTLFEKSPVNLEKQNADLESGVIEPVFDEQDDSSILEAIPPGLVEQTVRVLAEQGLLPENNDASLEAGPLIKSSSNSGIDSETLPSEEQKFVSDAISKEQKLGIQAKEQELGTQAAHQSLVSWELDAELVPGNRPSPVTGEWLSQRQVHPFPHKQSLDNESSERTLVEGNTKKPIAPESSQPARTLSNKNDLPVDSDFAFRPANLLPGKSDSKGLDMGSPDKNNPKITVDSTLLSGKNESERSLTAETKITLPTENKLGEGKQSSTGFVKPEEVIDFEGALPFNERKRATNQTGRLQGMKIARESIVQPQALVTQVKPVIQQIHAPSLGSFAEIAAVDSAAPVSDFTSAADSLSEAKSVLNSRVAVEDLPGKLTALVQQRLVNGVKIEGWRYQVYLHPEELGSVEVQMEMIDGRLEARILASNVAARDLLSEHLAKLEESLQNSGIKESLVQVGLEQRDGSKRRFDSNEDNQSKQAQLAEGDENTPKEKPKSDGELDLFV